jgi:putative DNA primase/helicase
MKTSEDFRAAMGAFGLKFEGTLISDGRLRRFKASGDRERNSWYVLHDGPSPAGAFGCWKRGINERWHGRNGSLSEAELKDVRRHWQDAAFKSEQAKTEGHAKARKTAEWILSRSTHVKSHDYLSSKGVNPIGNVREYRGALVLELRDVSGELHSLQFISPDGSKRFLTGGRVAGCFYMLFENPVLPVVICEGYATAASIHDATGYSVAAAISDGNLLAVATAFRLKYPKREIIISSDNDAFTDGNPGVVKATEAAKAIGAKLAVVQFTDISTKPTDFNDLACLEGLEMVKRQIENARPQQESDEEILHRLAMLPLLEYERRRGQAAKTIGCRTSVLDKLVDEKRPEQTDGALQGGALDIVDPELWSEPVNGADVLNEVVETFLRYIVLPVEAAWVLALWCVHAHVYELFDLTPRLNISSPQKQCGKTTLRDVVAELVPRPVSTENLTTAVLFRVIESHRPTLLADECDAWLRDNEELRGMLNAGHRRGGKALRCEGEKNEVRAFNVFAPAVLSGIGELPGTLQDRSIKVRLERAKPGELRERFDLRRTGREQEVLQKIARFCADNRTSLEACDPALPPVAFNRIADNWRPLFAIAEVAGGDWPQRAAAALTKLVSKEDADSQGIGTILLVDIQQIFREAEAERVFSEQLVKKLVAMTDRPWPEANRGKPVTETWLANRLRPFRILPKTIRIEPGRAKGYKLADFKEAFARYIPEQGDSTRDGVTIQQTSAACENSSRDSPYDCHGSKSPETPVDIGLSPRHGFTHCEASVIPILAERTIRELVALGYTGEQIKRLDRFEIGKILQGCDRTVGRKH